MYLFGVPPKIAEHTRLLIAWAADIKPLPREIHLPADLNVADDCEDAAIETYAYLTHGRG